MKKDNNINNYLNIACKALGAVVSILTIAKGIKQLCTSESPAKKRKEDEKFFERKQQILVQAHQEKVKADTASYEEKRRIDAKYKNATHPDQAITISDEQPQPREGRSIHDIVNNPTCEHDTSLIRNYISKGGVTMIYSPDGNGKSTIGSQICLDIANGDPCLLLPEEERTSLEPQYVFSYDIETEDDDFIERYGGIADKLPKERLEIIDEGFDSLDEFFYDLVERIDSVDGNVLINLDSISMVLPSLNGSNPLIFFRRLKKIQRDYKNNEGRYITVLIINHSTKDQEVFLGSSKIGNFTTSRLAILPCEKGDDYKIVKVEKLRKSGSKESFIIRRVDEPWLHFEYDSPLLLESDEKPCDEGSNMSNGYKLNSSVISKMEELLAKKVAYKKIAERLNISTKTIQRYVKEKKEVMAQAV
jgi:transposase